MKEINIVKNIIIFAINYLEKHESNGDPMVGFSVKTLSEQSNIPKAFIKLYDFDAISSLLSVAVNDLFVCRGEDIGWATLISDLLEASSVIGVNQTQKSPIVIFSYDGYHFTLNTVKNMPVITASKQFFEYLLTCD